MDDMISDAKKLYAEAINLFENSRKQNNKALQSEACGKCWKAVIRAADALLQKKGLALPKGDRERRACLEVLEKVDVKVREKELADRLSTRYHHLYEEGALGYMDPVRTKNELDRAKRFIDDIEKLMSG